MIYIHDFYITGGIGEGAGMIERSRGMSRDRSARESQSEGEQNTVRVRGSQSESEQNTVRAPSDTLVEVT